MSTEENKAIAQRYAMLLESGSLDGADELFSPDFKFHPPGSPVPLDLDAWKHFTSMFQSAFPDLRYIIEDTIVEGDKFVERLRFEGTHRGDFQGIPPTGKRVSFSGMSIMHMKDGRIAELWGQFDALGMMQQLGVIPAMG
ncbi:MAG: ester cyclase [Ktedonobacteraceae bacterium]